MSNINPLQTAIDFAAAPIQQSWENYKAAKSASKKLIKNIGKDLETDSDYLQACNEEKQLKKKRRDLSEQISDLKQQKELMLRNHDDYEQAVAFVNEQEEKFLTERDTAITTLSKALEKNGLTAEVGFKSGDLTLVVARMKEKN